MESPPSGAAGVSSASSHTATTSSKGEVAIQDHVATCLVLSEQGKQLNVGIATLDRKTKEFVVGSLVDNVHLSLLEAQLLRLRPGAVVLVASDKEMMATAKVRKLLAKFEEIFVKEIRPTKSEFSIGSQQEDLTLFLRSDMDVKHHIRQELSYPSIRSALGHLIEECALKSTPEYFGGCLIRRIEPERFLGLDRAAAAALNLSGGDAYAASSSLYSLLKKCRTAIGARLLRQWLYHPSRCIQEISDRHDVVELFVENDMLRRAVVSEHMRHVCDLDVMAGKLNKVRALAESQDESIAGLCSLSDLVTLYWAVVASFSLSASLSAVENAPAALGALVQSPLQKAQQQFKNFLRLMEHTVEIPPCDSVREAYREVHIKRSLDPRLRERAARKDAAWACVEAHREKVEHSLRRSGASGKGKIVMVVPDPSWTFVLRVTKKDQPLAMRCKNFRQVKINKAEFLFTSDELTDLAEEYKDARDALEAAEQSVVEKTLTVAATYGPVVARLSEAVATLDVLVGFASLAALSAQSFVRPTMSSDSGRLVIKDGRHPLVEVALETSERGTGRQFVANDIEMIKGESHLVVVTGPNMSGKSTFIRQVALACVMAQMGSFVPCRAAELPVLSNIFCRVGASDAQLRGMSTFYAEMVEAAAITDIADRDSLVIVDELGRGTSTYEGFGLAYALGDYLAAKVQAFTLFATHFHELSVLEKDVPGVKNVCVNATVQENNIDFCHRVTPGVSDKSLGVQIAALAGFPPAVVAAAENIALQLEASDGTIQATQTNMVASNVHGWHH